MFDVFVAMIGFPGERFRADAVRDEDVLVLSIAHGEGYGGVVEEEAVPPPRLRSLGDPVGPGVEEAVVDEVDVGYAKLKVPGGLARPIAVQRGGKDVSEEDGRGAWRRRRGRRRSFRAFEGVDEMRETRHRRRRRGGQKEDEALTICRSPR